MPLQSEPVKLLLDGKWNLEDLSDVTKDLVQLYGFAWSLQQELSETNQDEIDHIYAKFPWRGGYSTVNFFNQLFHKIPGRLRPQIKSIQYNSPGFIEIMAVLAAVGIAGQIVRSVCKTLDKAVETYNKLQEARAQHKLTKVDIANRELRLTEAQWDFAVKASKEMAETLGLDEGQQLILEKKTEKNPAMKLAILLSVFRRVRPLAEAQRDGKLLLPPADKGTSDKTD